MEAGAPRLLPPEAGGPRGAAAAIVAAAAAANAAPMMEVPRRQTVVDRLRKRIENYRKRQSECLPKHDRSFNGFCEQNLQDTMLLKQKFLETKAKRAAKKSEKKTETVTAGGTSAPAGHPMAHLHASVSRWTHVSLVWTHVYRWLCCMLAAPPPPSAWVCFTTCMHLFHRFTFDFKCLDFSLLVYNFLFFVDPMIILCIKLLCIPYQLRKLNIIKC
jgi:hypothetical protein